MRGIASPAIDTARDERPKYGKQPKDGENRHPNRGARDLIFVGLRSRMVLLAVRQVIFGKQVFFVKTQIAGNGAHKSAIENAPGKFVPLFVFQGFEIARTDSRGRGDFFHRHLAQLALALQAFAKISPGHESKPVLADTCGAVERSISRSIANQPAAAGAPFLLKTAAEAAQVWPIDGSPTRDPIRSAEGA